MEAPLFVLETTGENASTTVLLLDVPAIAAVAAMAAAVSLLRRFVEGIVDCLFGLTWLCGVSNASIMMASTQVVGSRQRFGATSFGPLTQAHD